MYCGRGPRDVELRPYGKDGRPVCFSCANETPERKAEAQRQMRARMTVVEGPIALTEDGPMGTADAAARLPCAGCGRIAATRDELGALAHLAASSARRVAAGERLPTLAWYCATCTATEKPRTVPPVCARCGQPIGFGQLHLVERARPVHAACPDWLEDLRADKAQRNAAAALEVDPPPVALDTDGAQPRGDD
jgi:hypothetical protein